MSNRYKNERVLLTETVEQLLSIHRKTGRISPDQWVAASEVSTYSIRHIKRTVAKRLQPSKSPQPFSLTDDMIMSIFSSAGRLQQAYRKLLRQGHKLPCSRHFSRVANQQLGAVALAAARGGIYAARNVKATVPMQQEHRCQTFELDHTELPIWIVPTKYRIESVRPYLTVALDRATRYPLAWVVTIGRPSASEVRACLVQAMSPRLAPDGKTIVGGRPQRAVWDRGLEFLAESITQLCQRHEVIPYPLPAYTPEGKPHLERFWRFLKEDGLSSLPGYTDGPRSVSGKPDTTGVLLGENEFVQILEDWFATYVCEHVVSTIGMTPLQAWQRDHTPVDAPPEQTLWRDLLVADKAAKVSKNGVRFKTHDFTAAELSRFIGRKLEIRYLPHDLNFIELFDNDRHICTAYRRDSLSEDQRQDVIKGRNAEFAKARRWGSQSNRLRYRQHQDTYPVERTRNGVPILEVPDVALDIEVQAEGPVLAPSESTVEYEQTRLL